MPFVYECAADDTWATVYVLVVAPCCEVDVPVVELEGDVPYCVCEIPANSDAQCATVSCYQLNVEELA